MSNRRSRSIRPPSGIPGTCLMIGFLLSGCLGPSDPGALHLRVYNETPHEVDLQIDLMQDGQGFNASMTLPGHDQTREGLPPSGDIRADLDAGRYKVRVLVDAHPCTPPEEPPGWDGTVGSINHVVGAIWAVNVMPDLSCKISKTATA